MRRFESQNLYPVVQDLTDVEYGGYCCCDEVLGSFRLGDLAMPVSTPRTLPPTPPRESNQPHKRGNSMPTLTQPQPSMDANHRRFHSFPSRENADEMGEFDGDKFNQSFVLTRQVFRGRISSVWECVHREEGTRHCVKIIDKRRFTSSLDDVEARREMAMLNSLQAYQSQRFSPVLQITKDSHQFYIVMKFEQGGSLASLLQTKHHLEEDQVKLWARSLLEAVQELHQLSIGHFDLQPENLLLNHDGSRIVLCDFGKACYYAPHQGFERGKRYGRLHFAAPEAIVQNSSCGLAADMWSVGVVLYSCFCGRLPFEDVSRRRLKDLIAKVEYRFYGEEWLSVSRGAKQFLSSLLHPDPQVRLTVDEALAHPWLAMPETVSNTTSAPKLRSSRKKLAHRLWARLRPSGTPEPTFPSRTASMSTMSSRSSSFNGP